MTTGIYLLTSPDGKEYVGKSWETKHGIKGRWNSHKRSALKNEKGCTYLYAAIRKHGWDNFRKEIIHEISFETHGEDWKKIISDTEDREIRTRNSMTPNGYNLVVGFNTAHVEISDETRERMSARSKGENNPMFGKPRTDEVKEKLRIANTGKTYPPRGPEYSAKMSELNKGEKHPMFGKKHTEEAKKAIGEKIRGRKDSEDTKAKKSAALKGRVVSVETRQKSYKKVEQWSKDGKTLIATFMSLTDAAEITHINKSGISGVANNKPQKKTAGGFVWKYVTELKA